MRDVYVIGSKGIPAGYGGFETFVEHLTKERQSREIRYHVACMDTRRAQKECYGADCFHLKVPAIGPAKAVWYDLAAFCWCLKDIRKRKVADPVVYVLACRIGPFIWWLKRKLRGLGGVLFVNPDGHEWLRAKWNRLIRKYWKYSEKGMVKHADLLICDSKNIQSYIEKEYKKYKPQTVFLAYGTNVVPRNEETPNMVPQNEETRDVAPQNEAEDEPFQSWLESKGLTAFGYYLVVGRFVPENNYETMLREFLRCQTKRTLVLITNVEQNGFYEQLKRQTGFAEDARICFAGTVYDEALLVRIRQSAYGYLHGHEVGGTNPSLLEALAATDLNLLLDVGFNREAGGEAALYWTKEQGSLAALLDQADQMPAEARRTLGEKARLRMRERYSWQKIIARYEDLFLKRADRERSK